MTVLAKDRGATKYPAVDLGTNFDVSNFYQYVSSVLSRSAEYRTQLFSSRYYFQIWSIKSAKKRHLCASISANNLHGVLIFVILQVTPPIVGGRNYFSFLVLFSFVIYVWYVAINILYDIYLRVVL